MKFDIGTPNKIKITCTGVIRDVCEKDKEILKTHKFQIKEPEKYIMTIKCTICAIEADIIHNVIHCFYDNTSVEFKYLSCSQVIMEKACI